MKHHLTDTHVTNVETHNVLSSQSISLSPVYQPVLAALAVRTPYQITYSL